MGRKVSSKWNVYNHETDRHDTIEIGGIITDYDGTTDRYKVRYEDEDNPEELEAIPLVGDGSELRLIDSAGMYETKVNEQIVAKAGAVTASAAAGVAQGLGRSSHLVRSADPLYTAEQDFRERD